ncbi:MAG: hypothetical protein IPJ07_06415 [Acidobacteria bacterium]|nr:hypothetical protein [Acidobacteriota bacterium]
MVRILIAVFVGANFVASIFLSWMPTFLTGNSLSLSMAGLTSGTAYQQIASIIGWSLVASSQTGLSRRYLGGRMMAQALGLFGGVIFIFSPAGLFRSRC